MADRSSPTLADFVVIAISSALIIGMILSLVYFLAALLYRGEYSDRLHYILFFFTFGMVLIARVSMETAIADRAPLYGAVLAFLVWIGLNQFVTYASDLNRSRFTIHAMLVGLIWWLAYRITYSCTHIDEKAESTGFGVLQAAGLEKAPEDAKVDKEPATDPRASWRERYQQFRSERKTKNTPGIWVVYFGVGALPIFGLGQSLLDVNDRARRAWTFALMILYVSSAIGLLATTSFLGLRRYLRQRRAAMPASVTIAWLTSAFVILFGFVVAAALLPRPRSEFSLFNLPSAESKRLDPSKHAVQKSDGTRDKGPEGEKKDGKEPGDSGKAADKGGRDGKDKSGSDGKEKGKPGSEKDGRKGEKDKGPSEGAKSGDKKDGDSEDRSDNLSEGRERGPGFLTEAMQGLQNLLTRFKWLIFAVLATIFALMLLRSGLGYLANFLSWARRLLEMFRTWWMAPFRSRNEADAESPKEIARRKFFAHSNPFTDGRAEGMLPGDLVRYSFEALERWADLWDLPRLPEETPQEFGDRLSRKLKKTLATAEALTGLFARVLYARGPLPPSWLETTETFWDELDAAPRPTGTLEA